MFDGRVVVGWDAAVENNVIELETRTGTQRFNVKDVLIGRQFAYDKIQIIYRNGKLVKNPQWLLLGAQAQ